MVRSYACAYGIYGVLLFAFLVAIGAGKVDVYGFGRGRDLGVWFCVEDE
jgi:hypothetical protein